MLLLLGERIVEQKEKIAKTKALQDFVAKSRRVIDSFHHTTRCYYDDYDKVTSITFDTISERDYDAVMTFFKVQHKNHFFAEGTCYRRGKNKEVQFEHNNVNVKLTWHEI